MPITRYRKNLGLESRRMLMIRQLRPLLDSMRDYTDSIPIRRKKVIKIYEYLNFHSLVLFGFSGPDGRFTKIITEKTKEIEKSLNEYLKADLETQPIRLLNEKLLRLTKTFEKKLEDQKMTILLTLSAFLPQDLVREISQKYI